MDGVQALGSKKDRVYCKTCSLFHSCRVSSHSTLAELSHSQENELIAHYTILGPKFLWFLKSVKSKQDIPRSHRHPTQIFEIQIPALSQNYKIKT